jgi:hypothetical protein
MFIKSLLLPVIYTLGGLIVLIVVLYFSIRIYDSFEHETAVFYRNAEFVDFNFLKNLDEQIKEFDNKHLFKRLLRKTPARNAHEYQKGEGNLFLYHWKSPNDWNISDEETFAKISFWIAGSLDKGVTVFNLKDNNEIKAIYTKGSVVWKTRNCSWLIDDGDITVNLSSKQVKVFLDVGLHPIANLHTSHCETRRLKKHIVMRQKKLETE